MVVINLPRFVTDDLLVKTITTFEEYLLSCSSSVTQLMDEDLSRRQHLMNRREISRPTVPALGEPNA